MGAASAWSEQGLTELLETMKRLPAASAYHIPPSTGYAQLCIIKRFLRNGLTGKSLEMPDVINEKKPSCRQTGSHIPERPELRKSFYGETQGARKWTPPSRRDSGQ